MEGFRAAAVFLWLILMQWGGTSFNALGVDRFQQGFDVYVADWGEYIKNDTRLSSTGLDIFRNDYADQVVDLLPTVPAATHGALSEVVDAAFWLPYQREITPRSKHKKPPKRGG